MKGEFAIDKVYGSDIIYISTKEDWFYLVVVIDLYLRKIVGYLMNKRINSDLIVSVIKN